MTDKIKNKKLNFRDLGGIKVSGGKSVRHNLILRSAKLSKLGSADKLTLEKYYKVKKVIDFRAEEEKKGKTDIIPDGAEYIHIPFFNEANMAMTGGMGSDVLSAIKKSDSKEELYSYIPELTNVYPIVVTDDYALSQLSKTVKIIMNNREGSVLFHCTAGKDRTGITAALILKMLGASDEDILEDYLKTNEISAKNGKKYARLAKVFLRSKKIADKTYRVFLADKSYLKSAYDAMLDKFGSFDVFLSEGLGITDDEITDFKNYILE